MLQNKVYSFTLYSFYCLRLIVHNTKGRIILKTTSNLASYLRFRVDNDFTNHTEIPKNGQISTSVGCCWTVKGFQLQGGFAPLTRGTAPGPRWGHCPQTPIIGSRSALAMRPPWKLSDNSTTGYSCTHVQQSVLGTWVSLQKRENRSGPRNHEQKHGCWNSCPSL